MKAGKHTEDAVMYTNKNDEEFTKPVAVNNPVYSSEGATFNNPTYSVCLVSLPTLYACDLNRISVDASSTC